jgi:hypothetical protein
LYRDEDTEHDQRSKISIALEVISKVIDHLKPNDQLAVITFDNEVSIIQTIKRKNITNQC